MFTYDCEVIESDSDVDNVISNSNLLQANHPNEACVEKLKSLRENFNLEVKEERYDLLDELNSLISDWRDPLPNLRDIFRPDEIERLLFDTVVYMIIKYKDKYKDSSVEDMGFIEFVARSGYKHELELGENDKTSPRRHTPIHHANKLGCYKIIPDLFKIYNRYDVNCVDEFGITHFYVACKFGCEDVVKKFLRFGQDPNHLWHKRKESPSDMSLDNNEDKNQRLQLRYEVDPNPFYSYRSSPLQDLLWNEDNFSSGELFLKMSDELKKPSEDNYRHDWGNRPLLLALVYKNTKVAELLLKNGANPNLSELEMGWTALHIVSMGHRYYDLAKMLFKICDDMHQPLLINARDRLGKTPLHLALENSCNGYKNVIELLLRRGADPNLTNGWGYTLLHSICTSTPDLCFCAEILFQVCRKINRTVQVNARDKDGNTPLHLVLKYPCEKVLDLLLRNGADPNSRNTKGLSPLHVICEEINCERTEMFFKLCEQNDLRVEVNAQDEMGRPPLHIALSHRQAYLTTLLLAKGADPNLADAKGLTSLHIMCKEFIWAICDNRFLDFFIKTCAKNNIMLQIDARDKLGRTPLQWAVASLMPKAVDILINNGADLSSFTFPDEAHSDEIYHLSNYKFALRPVAGALATIKRLQKGGYELDRSDVLKIMKIFATYGLFEKSTDVLKSLYDGMIFRYSAKELMIKPDLSFYKLIQLQPKEVEKRLKYKKYLGLRFVNILEALEWTKEQRKACELHLSEIISRGFFRRWALDPFMELIHYRLPILCCEMIIEQLNNEDLYHICLAVANQSS